MVMCSKCTCIKMLIIKVLLSKKMPAKASWYWFINAQITMLPATAMAHAQPMDWWVRPLAM